MPKTFYTERDIEDLFNNGVLSMVVNDEVVVTDLGRERAGKLGFELIREHDQPPSAPVRPYITKQKSPTAAPSPAQIPSKLAKKAMAANKPPQTSPPSLEQRVQQAVIAKVGDTVDPKLLETIIRRVLNSVGGK